MARVEGELIAVRDQVIEFAEDRGFGAARVRRGLSFPGRAQKFCLSRSRRVRIAPPGGLSRGPCRSPHLVGARTGTRVKGAGLIRLQDSWHHAVVQGGGPAIENLTDEQRAWLAHSEMLWREAHRIAAAHPDMDPGDVYHALRCLELPPAERLRRGLTRVRHRPHIG